jgi:hypothetical protein
VADDYYSFSRAPAFAARMRAALAAAPATAWATDLPITTCVALLAALDECMLSGGSALYEEKFRGRFAISEAAAAIQSRVVAAVDACPREGISPAHDSGLSREFLHEWSDAALHLYKHVYWAAWLTAETWSALLAALLYRPWSQFDALGIEAFLRRVEANLARVRAMSDESLIAYAQPRSVYRSEG